MHKKEETAHHSRSQISLEIDLTFIVNFEHSSQMDLSHTCPQRGLNPTKERLEAIFKIYHLVIFQAKDNQGVAFFIFVFVFFCLYLYLQAKKEKWGVAFLYLYLQAQEYQGVATSKLVYAPDIGDDGRYLACRVLPTSKAGKSLEDTWEIKVLCESNITQIFFSEIFLKITETIFSKSLSVISQNHSESLRICS